MFAQRLAGHSVARITRALNDAGIPCPSAADRDGTRTGPARHGRCAPWRRSWPIPGTPGGRCGTGDAFRQVLAVDENDVTAGLAHDRGRVLPSHDVDGPVLAVAGE
jgi:hypothetical protein